MNIEFINDAYTKDNLRLPCVHFESTKKDICVVFIHGMCGTIIDNYFATVWGKKLSENNIGFIYEHNRGHSIENDLVCRDGTFKRYGCMYELFEESILDIDLALDLAYSKGYKRIVLMGHSYGCNKVIHYYYKKKPNLMALILASAPDMVGIHNILEPNKEGLLDEAKNNLDNNEGDKLLSRLVEDYMYMSSKTYYDWYNEESNLNNLPILENPKDWKEFSSIDIPILTFSGGNEEYYYKKLELLKSKALNCPNFVYKIINDTGHTYQGKEDELGNIILEFIDNLKST